MSEEAIPLSGGNVNELVVRIGNTVRRNLSTASPTVHRLLLHLEAKGFSASPRFLGIDEKQREILSFVEGETAIPASIWQDDDALIATAEMLKRFHEATLDFVAGNGAIWANAYPDATRHEVICHNDFAPYNFIYRQGIPVAIIDFDLAGPGPRLRDIAYAAYWMTPLSFNSADQVAHAEADLRANSRRLKLFCAAYGIRANANLLAMIDEVLAFMADEAKMCAVVGAKAAARLKSEGHLAHWQRERASYQAHEAEIQANLSTP